MNIIEGYKQMSEPHDLNAWGLPRHPTDAYAYWDAGVDDLLQAREYHDLAILGDQDAMKKLMSWVALQSSYETQYDMSEG